MALSFHVMFYYHDALLFRVPTWGLVFFNAFLFRGSRQRKDEGKEGRKKRRKEEKKKGRKEGRDELGVSSFHFQAFRNPCSLLFSRFGFLVSESGIFSSC